MVCVPTSWGKKYKNPANAAVNVDTSGIPTLDVSFMYNKQMVQHVDAIKTIAEGKN